MTDTKNPTAAQQEALPGWDEPSEIPADDPAQLRLDYIDAAAACIARWFFKNYEDPAESCPYDSEEGGYLGDVRETYGELFDDLDSDWFPNGLWEEILRAALDKIEDGGCGDLCTPLFGRYGQDPEDIAEFAITAVDLEQDESGGYMGA